MAIPDYQSIMLPLLQELADGNEYKTRILIERLGERFKLNEEERKELLGSGTQPIFDNRVGWAKTYLKKAGLLDSPKRASVQITAIGKEVLNQRLDKIDAKYLKRFDSFNEFVNASKIDVNNTQISPITSAITEEKTPEEILDKAYQELRKSLALELRKKIIEQTPAYFEKLVVELLVKMGYGGSIKDAGRATKLTNDAGIDGIIKEDKLGLDVIYIQAKRWDNQPVGRPDIQSFVGALDGQRANKGIFITTSRFSDSAKEYVKNITKKVILIDGEELADYMIEYGLGVSTSVVYEVKKIDNDYFGE